MMGLMVLMFFAFYFAISLSLIFAVLSWAAKNKRSGWWGVLVAFVMYNLVFWDWIPTVVTHKYYCSSEAGFWIYKTVDQWKMENPGEIEKMVFNKDAPSEREGNVESYTDTYFISQRFNWVVKRHGIFFFNRWLHEQSVIDIKTGEVLVKYVDFSTSQISPQAGWNGWKTWLTNEHCANGEYYQGLMYSYKNKLRGQEK